MLAGEDVGLIEKAEIIILQDNTFQGFLKDRQSIHFSKAVAVSWRGASGFPRELFKTANSWYSPRSIKLDLVE